MRRQVQKQTTLNDATSNMVFHVTPLPECGNRYLLAAADSTLKIFDLETEQVNCAARARKCLLPCCPCRSKLCVLGAAY